jgi:hypothetical protein
MSAEMNDSDSKQKFTSLTVNQIIGIDIRLTTNVNKFENSKWLQVVLHACFSFSLSWGQGLLTMICVKIANYIIN